MRTAFFAGSFVLLAFMAFPAFGQSDDETAAKAAEQAGRFAQALTHYTAALQATAPGSEAEQRLLERAASIASKVRPLPALPADAERRFVRGVAMVRGAKEAEAFLRAAEEFRAALRVAPWLAEAHLNLGIVLDKAERHADAIRSLKLNILAAPNAKDAKEAQRLIYEIEVRQEDAARAKSKAGLDRAEKAYAEWAAQERRPLLQKYVGVFKQYLDGNYVHTFRGVMNGELLEITHLGITNPQGQYRSITPYGDIYQVSVKGTRVEGTYLVAGGRSHPIVGTIETDGSMRLNHKKTWADPRNPLDKSLYTDRDHVTEFKPPN